MMNNFLMLNTLVRIKNSYDYTYRHLIVVLLANFCNFLFFGEENESAWYKDGKKFFFEMERFINFIVLYGAEYERTALRN